MDIRFTFDTTDQDKETISNLVMMFYKQCEPVENEICLIKDRATNAVFCECHIYAGKLIELCTIDAPLDPEDQGEYRSNREIDEDNSAFIQMKEDAKHGRVFSNIVAEYTVEFDETHPIKIIGGQHRIEAIREALVLPESVIFFDTKSSSKPMLQAFCHNKGLSRESPVG